MILRFARAVGLALLCLSEVAAQRPRPQPRPVRAGPIQGDELVVIATDDSLDSPEQVEAGLVNIRLFNRGKRLHSVLLIKVERLERLQTIADLLRTNDWNVTWIRPLGGPERVVPGGMSTAIMRLEPGRYILADLGDGIGQGRLAIDFAMLKELSVLGPERRMPLPPTELSVVLTEWAITLTAPLAAGRRTVRVENMGRTEHNVWVVRLLPGHTMGEARQWVERPTGSLPFEAVGGTTTLAPGRNLNLTLDLLPGEYALICGLWNPLSKKTHSAHGMFKQVTVTR